MIAETSYHPPVRLVRALSILAAIGVLGAVAGFMAAPDRTWANLLLV